MAPETLRLPTIAEIEAATEIISTPDTSAKVIRVNEHFAVKMGHGVPLIEAENMKSLAANSKVPVPNVHAAFRDPNTNKTYIIMEYLPGDTLQKLLPPLNQIEKATISKLVKDAITELRSIPPPGYFGMLNRQPYLDGVFWTENLNPVISGPFATQRDMNVAILERLRQTESDQYIRLLRNMINQTLNNHRIVFTHGDLQPKNIMVERTETVMDARSSKSLYWIGKVLGGIQNSGSSAMRPSPVDSNWTGLNLCLIYWSNIRWSF